MKFQIIPHNVETFIPPKRATEGSAAYDLFAQADGTAEHIGAITDLGFSAQFDPDFVALLLPRSGHGVKRGMVLTNGTGVIDADYPGTWGLSLHISGHGSETPDMSHEYDHPVYSFKRGEAIAQVIFVRKEEVELEIIAERTYNTDRVGGFGSTGK